MNDFCRMQAVAKLWWLGPVPPLDEATFRVRVDGRVQHAREFTLEDLRTEFGCIEVIVALQVCGLSRRYNQ